MHLGADMMGDKAIDPLSAGRRQPFARVRQPIRQPVDPDARPGLSMTSMTLASSSHAAIAGPNAVRNMRAPRVIASEQRESIPARVTGARSRPMNGDDWKETDWDYATSLRKSSILARKDRRSATYPFGRKA